MVSAYFFKSALPLLRWHAWNKTLYFHIICQACNFMQLDNLFFADSKKIILVVTSIVFHFLCIVDHFYLVWRYSTWLCLHGTCFLFREKWSFTHYNSFCCIFLSPLFLRRGAKLNSIKYFVHASGWFSKNFILNFFEDFLSIKDGCRFCSFLFFLSS